ncbi:Ferric/cupric reductase transmembrane component 2-like protein 7 [Colletotrichum chlorophyti]|uniref:Ferric/cupric reductase transmembrane component 2-like protein 7 n=1 Tax=Colletotrichum chlorophyti TaxID=708187 RepID=A0A1Q8RD40_9PEZI|nr:Ferric/cupric reductase transmembrane component 2-like protein 7 [Colletotrichum chlorophyti]
MAGGSPSGPSAYPKLFAKRLAMNHEAVVYYAIILSGIMVVFITSHLVRLAAQKTGVATNRSGLARPFTSVSRFARRLYLQKFTALPSLGHFLVIIGYLAVNIALTFTHLSFELPVATVIGARAGWFVDVGLAIANIALVVFLGLKNTPLGYLTAWSYERLNILHQVAGYVAMAQIVIHGATYSSYFLENGNAARLRVHEEIYGITSGFTFLILVLAGAIVRLWYYELFYILHVSFFAISMVLVGLHQPEMQKKMVIVTGLASGLWLFDRIVRLARVVLYSLNNTATVYPLPNGGTRIVLKKAPMGASSGEHCFLWIPKIRAFEMHPFTMAAMDPLEFVVNSYDGFTRDLHQYAVRNPGATLKASVEGSYGTFPSPTDYDKTILIAGGSGASFTVGMALNMLKHMTPGSRQTVTFIWIVKDNCEWLEQGLCRNGGKLTVLACLQWFAGHLRTIREAFDANSPMMLFVTRAPGSQGSSELSTATPEDKRSNDGAITSEASTPLTTSSEKFDPSNLSQPPPKIITKVISDPEKSGAESDANSPVSPVEHVDVAGGTLGIPIIHSRPDVGSMLRDMISQTPADQRVLVVGCGPDSLMEQVRNNTAYSIRGSGPAVTLHCEQFGW